MDATYLRAPEPWHFRNPALVVGHPGHELKVFGWASKHQPRVYVLTDGSVRGSMPRIHATASLLAQCGASKDEDKLFGAFTDEAFYHALLEKHTAIFLDIAERLAQSFVQNAIDVVAADAIEGYSPTHDLCRILVEAAAHMASRQTGCAIANYDFLLTEGQSQAQHDDRCFHLQLDEDLLKHKLDAAMNYTEMREEVELAINHHGAEYFRTECLRKVTAPFSGWPDSYKPEYEIRGEQQVARGIYRAPIRYHEHVQPLINVIRKYAMAEYAIR